MVRPSYQTAMRQPIERQKVYELLSQRLAEEIGRGSLRPGDPLPAERQLAVDFGVGRSSVREALRMLESQGLILSEPGGVVRVVENPNPLNRSLRLLLELTDASVRELFEVRKMLEVECAGLAAERRVEGDLLEMEAAIAEMDEGLGSRDRYIAADLRFHLAVATASQNRIASHIMLAIRDVMRRALMSIYEIPGSAERSNEHHRHVLDAIRAGGTQRSRTRMREHIVSVEHDIMQMTSQLGEPVTVARASTHGGHR